MPHHLQPLQGTVQVKGPLTHGILTIQLQLSPEVRFQCRLRALKKLNSPSLGRLPSKTHHHIAVVHFTDSLFSVWFEPPFYVQGKGRDSAVFVAKWNDSHPEGLKMWNGHDLVWRNSAQQCTKFRHSYLKTEAGCQVWWWSGHVSTAFRSAPHHVQGMNSVLLGGGGGGSCLEKFSTPNSGAIFPISFNDCGAIFPIHSERGVN